MPSSVGGAVVLNVRNESVDPFRDLCIRDSAAETSGES
jgi:hypothetical protein